MHSFRSAPGSFERRTINRHVFSSVSTLLVFLALTSSTLVTGQTKTKPVPQTKTAPGKTAKSKAKPAKPGDELARLRKEFIEATNEYKELLKKQTSGLERNVTRAEEKLAQSQKLFAEGLISRRDLEASERELAEAKDKVAEVNRNLVSADSQIADTLLEAEAEAKIRKTRLRRGALVTTTALIRFNGGGGWSLGDSWKVQRFFQDTFKKQLPISVFGQGSIHDRWRLDHRNSMDISLHPDGAEGQALLGFLRANGIPFLAFRSAIPGTATGPHIHIGRPSHRY